MEYVQTLQALPLYSTRVKWKTAYFPKLKKVIVSPFIQPLQLSWSRAERQEQREKLTREWIRKVQADDFEIEFWREEHRSARTWSRLLLESRWTTCLTKVTGNLLKDFVTD